VKWVGVAVKVQAQVYHKSDYDRLGLNAQLVGSLDLSPGEQQVTSDTNHVPAAHGSYEGKLELVPGDYVKLIVADQDITEYPISVVGTWPGK
jgi:hypothetical protein